jgi:hypothetical protein
MRALAPTLAALLCAATAGPAAPPAGCPAAALDPGGEDGVALRLRDPAAPVGGFVWEPGVPGRTAEAAPAGEDAAFVRRDPLDPGLVRIEPAFAGEDGEGCAAGARGLVAYVIEGDALPAYVILAVAADDGEHDPGPIGGRPGGGEVPLVPLRVAPSVRAAALRGDGWALADVAPPLDGVHCLDGAGGRGSCRGILEDATAGLFLRRADGDVEVLPGCEDGCRARPVPLDAEICWAGEVRVVRRGEAAPAVCVGGAVSGFRCEGAGVPACAAVGGACRGGGQAAVPVGPPIPGGCTSIFAAAFSDPEWDVPSGGDDTGGTPGPSPGARAAGREAAGPASASLPSLSIEGSCPGLVEITVAGATPRGRLALVLHDPGVAEANPPACQDGGVETGRGGGLLSMSGADGSGALAVQRSVPAPFCGRLLRAVDAATCRQSPARALPALR